jgi:hypothetical protein
MPRGTAVWTGTLRVKIRRHLPLDHDLLPGLEDGFAFGEGQAPGGGDQVLPLQTGDFPCLGLALVGGDHDLKGVLHRDIPAC